MFKHLIHFCFVLYKLQKITEQNHHDLLSMEFACHIMDRNNENLTFILFFQIKQINVNLL